MDLDRGIKVFVRNFVEREDVLRECEQYDLEDIPFAKCMHHSRFHTDKGKEFNYNRAFSSIPR